jgi:hypothetical protein
MPDQDLTRKTPSAAEVMQKFAAERAAHKAAVRVGRALERRAVAAVVANDPMCRDGRNAVA